MLAILFQFSNSTLWFRTAGNNPSINFRNNSKIVVDVLTKINER